MVTSNPANISCKPRGVGLYELDDGRFQLIREGPLAPLMSGRPYLIVEQRLADLLAGFRVEGLTYEPVVIFNRASGKVHPGYVRIRGAPYFRHKDRASVPQDGFRLFVTDASMVFVSQARRDHLDRAGFDELEFNDPLKVPCG